MMGNVITRNTQELEQLEEIIRRNQQSFYEVGRALTEIRDRGLYRDVLGFETFEAYCKQKWDMSRFYAYRLIDAVVVIDNVDNCQQKPATESQARHLARLPTDKQKEAWTKAVETAPEGRITAAHVQKIVKEMTAPEPKQEKEEESEALFHLKRWWDRAIKKDRKTFLQWIEREGKK